MLTTITGFALECAERQELKGCQFMRQKPIGDYIVDFFCNKLKPVIEIDGISHTDKSESDQIRQKKIESLGL